MPYRSYKVQYNIFAILVFIIIFNTFFLNKFWAWYLLIFAIVALVYISVEIDSRKRQIWQKFAKDNGWYIGIADTDDLPLGIKFLGHTPGFTNVVSGEMLGKKFKLFSYRYWVGSGRSEVSYDQTIISADLSACFPYILLNSKKNQGGSRQTLKAAEKLSLEGNFDDYFDFYTQNANRIDALSLITPDIMQTVIDATKMYDIEIVGNKLFIYINGDKRNSFQVKNLFDGFGKLLVEIEHKSNTFKNSKLTNLSYTQIDMKYLNILLSRHSAFDRLNTKQVLILIIFILFFVVLNVRVFN